MPSPSSSPSVSIIIPVYNGRVFLEKLLESIMTATPSGKYEIIIIDDASDQEDMDALYSRYTNTPRFIIVRNAHNRGFAASNNIGLRASSGDYCYLLNSDTLVTPGWLTSSLRIFSNAGVLFPGKNIGAVQSKILLPRDEPMKPVVQTCGSVFDEHGWPVYWYHGRDPGDPVVNRCMLVDSFMGCGVLLRSDVVKQIHGFDEGFGKYYYEDSDLSLRMSSLGYATAYNPDSTIIHFHGVSTSGYITDREEFSSQLETGRKRFQEKWPVSRIREIIGRLR